MKFQLARDAFAEAVTWAARGLPLRPSVPVLAGLLVTAGEGELQLAGFDYETSARVRLPAEVAEPGTALVPGRLLAEICRSLPSAPVDVTHDGSRVGLTCGSARFALQTLPVEDYPALPEMPTAAGTVDSELLARAVGQTVVAAGRDDMLPVLTGVRVEIDGTSIALMATDRYRLGLRELSWNPQQPDLSVTALVPARVLADTAKSLTSSSEVTLALSATETGEGLIGLEGTVGGSHRQTTTRLLDGDFPKVRSLFPAESNTVARVDTAPLVDALKRVSLVAERNTPVRMAFADGMVTLDAGSGDEAQASEAVSAQIEGDDVSIGFNPSYLLDGLGAIDAPVVHLGFTTPTKPVALAGLDEQGSEPTYEFRYLLMPVRLQG